MLKFTSKNLLLVERSTFLQMPRWSSAKDLFTQTGVSSHFSSSYPVLYSVSHLAQLLPLKSVLASQVFSQRAFSSCFSILQHLTLDHSFLLEISSSFGFWDTAPPGFPLASQLFSLPLMASLPSLTSYMQLAPRILAFGCQLPLTIATIPINIHL